MTLPGADLVPVVIVGEVVDNHPEKIVTPLQQLYASILTGRIERSIHQARSAIVELAELLQVAEQGEIHRALGLRSWPEYVAAMFEGSPLPVESRDHRREIAAMLAGSGMSSRAIAPVLGVSQRTVADDVRAVEQFCSTELSNDETPARPVTGSLDDYPDPGPTRITGLDGKTYQRSSKPKTPAEPKLATAEKIVSLARKATDAVSAVEEAIAGRDTGVHRSALREARELIDRLLAEDAIEGVIEAEPVIETETVEAKRVETPTHPATRAEALAWDLQEIAGSISSIRSGPDYEYHQTAIEAALAEPLQRVADLRQPTNDDFTTSTTTSNDDWVSPWGT